MDRSLYDYCLAEKREKLLAQWHPTKNGVITPSDVSPFSHRKVWWCCERGHEWQAVVKSRQSGAKCPVCTNRVIIPGENDLAACHPDLAKQWHPKKNNPLTAKDVFSGSLRKVWWKCEKGHEWEARISARSSGMGCPVCAGKVIIPGENDLGTLRPDIAAQWHPTKNEKQLPETVAEKANRKVWWVCDKGHEYLMAVKDRTDRGHSCPYCCGKKVLVGFNDLATVNPQVAKEWHQALNGELTPEMVTAGSAKKVWWECSLGHIYKTWVYQRAGKRKYGCPVCGGRYKEERLVRYKEIMGENPCDGENA